jgi:hypothetical protein
MPVACPWQHVLMYTYYLMAILLGKDPKVRDAFHPCHNI